MGRRLGLWRLPRAALGAIPCLILSTVGAAAAGLLQTHGSGFYELLWDACCSGCGFKTTVLPGGWTQVSKGAEEVGRSETIRLSWLSDESRSRVAELLCLQTGSLIQQKTKVHIMSTNRPVIASIGFAWSAAQPPAFMVCAKLMELFAY